MRTKQVVDYPQGHICLEDKVAMMQRIQQMQIASKQNNLDQYGGPDYSALLKVLVESSSKEVQGLDAILHQE